MSGSGGPTTKPSNVEMATLYKSKTKINYFYIKNTFQKHSLTVTSVFLTYILIFHFICLCYRI